MPPPIRRIRAAATSLIVFITALVATGCGPRILTTVAPSAAAAELPPTTCDTDFLAWWLDHCGAPDATDEPAVLIRAVQAFANDDDAFTIAGRPVETWTAVDIAVMEDWTAANDAALTLFAESVRCCERPRYIADVYSSPTVARAHDPSELPVQRRLAACVLARARLAARRHDPAALRADVETLLSNARCCAAIATTFRLNGAARDVADVSDLVIAACLHDGWLDDAGTLAPLAEALEATELDAGAAVPGILASAMAIFCAGVERDANGNSVAWTDGSGYTAAIVPPRPPTEVAREIHDYVIGWRRLTTLPWDEREPVVRQWQAAWGDDGAFPKMAVADSVLLGMDARVRDATLRRNIAVVAARARLYRLKHGRWPASLDEVLNGADDPCGRNPLGGPLGLAVAGDDLLITGFEREPTVDDPNRPRWPSSRVPAPSAPQRLPPGAGPPR